MREEVVNEVCLSWCAPAAPLILDDNDLVDMEEPTLLPETSVEVMMSDGISDNKDTREVANEVCLSWCAPAAPLILDDNDLIDMEEPTLRPATSAELIMERESLELSLVTHLANTAATISKSKSRFKNYKQKKKIEKIIKETEKLQQLQEEIFGMEQRIQTVRLEKEIEKQKAEVIDDAIMEVTKQKEVDKRKERVIVEQQKKAREQIEVKPLEVIEERNDLDTEHQNQLKQGEDRMASLPVISDTSKRKPTQDVQRNNPPHLNLSISRQKPSRGRTFKKTRKSKPFPVIHIPNDNTEDVAPPPPPPMMPPAADPPDEKQNKSKEKTGFFAIITTVLQENPGGTTKDEPPPPPMMPAAAEDTTEEKQIKSKEKTTEENQTKSKEKTGFFAKKRTTARQNKTQKKKGTENHVVVKSKPIAVSVQQAKKPRRRGKKTK